MIDRIAIAGYRSIRSLVLKLGQLNVVTGPNGSGKSNLYRALRLIADAAEGRLVQSLAREGGFHSVLWAGPEAFSPEMLSGEAPVQGTLRKKPVGLRLGFAADPLSYSLDLGLPIPSGSMFDRDPEMKRECLWRGNGKFASRNMCADRHSGALRCRGEDGSWQDIAVALSRHVSMLAEYADPFAAPELIVMRETLRGWRFYDSFRTDSESPVRNVSVGTFTPVLSNDGSDLAAALQTVLEIGDHESLDRAIDDAFPGSELRVHQTDIGMRVTLEQPGVLRELAAAELSDGTLRFLLLVAALLTPRPPGLLVLNEPENSLHPDLIPALGRLIVHAAENSQVIVVSHNQKLVDELEASEICVPIRLEKRMGETIFPNADPLDQYSWKWPAR